MSTQPHSAEHGVPLWGMLDRLIRSKGCSGWPKTNPSSDKVALRRVTSTSGGAARIAPVSCGDLNSEVASAMQISA